MRDVRVYISENVLVLDGGIGTMLWAAGMPRSESPEAWMLRNPSAVRAVHEDYARAGADILTTNTFGASRIRLREFGIEDRVGEICELAVKLAKDVGGEALVAGSIGPLGELLPPFGEIDPKEAYDAFREQAIALEKSGADLIIIETMTDLREAQITLRAAKSAVRIPILINLAFDDGYRTVTGTPPDVGAVALGKMRPDAVGTNCGGAPEEMVDNVRKIKRYWRGALVAEPNAGIPVTKNGETTWPGTPEELAEITMEIHSAGANLIGSCCGSTPDFTSAIAKALKDSKPVYFGLPDTLQIASRTTLMEIGDELPIRLVGERINPAGRAKLRAEMAAGKMSRVRREALSQVQAGADILDVNASIPDADEGEILSNAIKAIASACDAPIFIDTSDLKALKQALDNCVGSPVINSITANEADLSDKLPLAGQFGTAIVALPLDESGIPKKPSERVRLVEKIAGKAREYGFGKRDILADPIVLSAASGENVAEISIATATLLKQRGFFNVCGLSNISHGMPNRGAINAAFLAKIAPYLDAVIVDPKDNRIIETLYAMQFLSNRDYKGKRFVELFSAKTEASEEIEGAVSLREEIIAGNTEAARELALKALNNSEPLDIINNEIVPALTEIGERYEQKQAFLPQIIGSGDSAKAAIAVLKDKLLETGQRESAGKILLATVEGDIHDIGKNLVATLLSAHGFEIIDLGKSVKTYAILKAIESEKPDAIGLSALMTTTLLAMEKAVVSIKKKYPELRVIIGGASVSTEFADRIGADGYANNAISAVRQFKKALKVK